MVAEMTYWLDIDELDDVKAIFRSDLHGLVISIPRKDWEGFHDRRPSRIQVGIHNSKNGIV
jgi:hypothetical protein